MEGHQQEEHQIKSKVLKVDSLKSWDSFVGQATNQGCPVSLLNLLNFCIISSSSIPSLFLLGIFSPLGFCFLSIYINFFSFPWLRFYKIIIFVRT